MVFHRCWSIAIATGIQFLHDVVIFFANKNGYLGNQHEDFIGNVGFHEQSVGIYQRTDWLIDLTKQQTWEINQSRIGSAAENRDSLAGWQTMESYQHKNGRNEYKQNMDGTSDAHQFSAIWGGNWGMSWSPDIRVGSTSSRASSKPIYKLYIYIYQL